MNSDESIRMPEDCAVVACGTLRGEMRHLVQTGFVNADQLFFAGPGLHEWPDRLERQLTRQLERALQRAEHVVVAYGQRCYMNLDTGMDTDGLLGRFGRRVGRVAAKNCVDMLADEDERAGIAAGDNVYWLTPGWVEYWDVIFKDWDAAMANETFPARDRAIVLDALDCFQQMADDDPEKLLRISDWTKLALEPRAVSLRRLRNLLRRSAERLGDSADAARPEAAQRGSA
jgi:hypothetical protein